MVQRVKEEGRIVVTLGGDHSIALGSVHGILQHYEGTGKSPCILWVDAHADINTTVGMEELKNHSCFLSLQKFKNKNGPRWSDSDNIDN